MYIQQSCSTALLYNTDTLSRLVFEFQIQATPARVSFLVYIYTYRPVAGTARASKQREEKPIGDVVVCFASGFNFLFGIARERYTYIYRYTFTAALRCSSIIDGIRDFYCLQRQIERVGAKKKVAA